MTTVDQILVWPGSKRARASQLAGMFGDDPRPVYCEPFLGSGVVYGCSLHASYGMAVLGDAAPRLIATYRAVRRDPAGVYAELARLPQSVAQGAAMAVTMGLPAPADDKRASRYADPWKAFFYDHRRRLNEWVPVRGEVADPAHAAAFIWHRSASFNGLMRTGPGGDNATAGDRVRLPPARSLTAFGAMLALGIVDCRGAYMGQAGCLFAGSRLIARWDQWGRRHIHEIGEAPDLDPETPWEPETLLAALTLALAPRIAALGGSND